MSAFAGLVAGIALTIVQISPPAMAAGKSNTLDGTSCTWVINELPLPAGWSSGNVHNSDRHDSFAGSGVDADGKTRPLVWHDGDVMVLDTPAGLSATAEDVNSRGDAVGVVFSLDTSTRGVLWRDGQMIDLPQLPGGGYAVPTAINNAGLIVGYAAGADTAHAVTWSADSPQSIHDLGVVAGSAYLTDVSDQGTIVGWTETVGDEFRQQAIAGTVRDGLMELPGPVSGTNSIAYAAAGRYVAGTAVLTAGSGDLGGPVVWEQTEPRALPGPQAMPSAVNDHGTVVGFSSDLGAVIWTGDDEQQLPSLTAGNTFSTSATAATDDDTVAGTSADAQGRSRPVTWSCAS
ncbi:hypothetical protein [Kribbella sp.]|uniref:hypothetical protein n=1 Tax=Kribbella sp. TaxID=1871183 RepID=UPI002D4C3418|nr:hypothetical protein [Kribbella sp.]HZX07717.1 hypothetical protein [Kribbella sp.]